MRLKLISCEVFYREMCHVIARSPNLVDLEFLPKGLHDIGSSRMRARMQAVVDGVDSNLYDAILLGYGLCNNGLAGVVAPAIPLVLPRAHDCITLFLGSRKRYIDYFNANPGVYFKTTGWIDRGTASGGLKQLSIQQQAGLNARLEEFIARYGEDNGRYLFDMLGDDKHNYGQFTFIEMGVEPNNSYEEQTRNDAAQRNWKFEKVPGSMALIQRLVDGPWSEDDFLVVPPGQAIAGSYDDDVIKAEPVADGLAESASR